MNTLKPLISVKPHLRQLQVCVWMGSEKLACHIASKKGLIEFIETPGATLFKGRLQLKHINNLIQCWVKNELKGTINPQILLATVLNNGQAPLQTARF